MRLVVVVWFTACVALSCERKVHLPVLVQLCIEFVDPDLLQTATLCWNASRGRDHGGRNCSNQSEFQICQCMERVSKMLFSPCATTRSRRGSSLDIFGKSLLWICAFVNSKDVTLRTPQRIHHRFFVLQVRWCRILKTSGEAEFTTVLSNMR